MSSIGQAPPPSPPPLDPLSLERIIDPKIYRVWDRFFSEFMNMPHCEFVQHEWEIYKSVGNKELANRVSSVYLSLIKQILPPSDELEKLINPDLLEAILHMHQNEGKAHYTDLAETVYKKICPPPQSVFSKLLTKFHDSEHIKQFREIEMDGISSELSQLAKNTYTAWIEPGNGVAKPHNRATLIHFFFELLATDLILRLKQIEHKANELLKDESLSIESQDLTIDTSPEIHNSFTFISTIFYFLDKTLRKKIESMNLENIKKRFEEKYYFPVFEGPIQEWISFLLTIPHKLDEIEDLDLSVISLTYLPSQFTSLPFRNLKKLNLSNNSLKRLAETEYFFPQSRHLTEIHLNDNKLEVIPDQLLKHCNLRLFDASSNRIRAFGAELGVTWTELRFFYCSNNCIDELPPYFGCTWPLCRRVELEDNHFTSRAEYYNRIKEILQTNLPKAEHKIKNFEQLLKEPLTT